MRESVKSPLCCRGGQFIHRRAIFGQVTVSERRYFTRYTTGSAKPEVQI